MEYINSNITLMKWMIAERLRRRAHAAAPHRRAGSLAGRTRSCSKRDADAEYAAVIEIDLADIARADRRLPERPRRREDAVRSGRREDRRGLHRQLHDQHRPLPRRQQAARRQARHPGQAVGRAADQDGRAAAQRGRPLRRARHAPARAWKCPAAACAWATRRRCKEGATVFSTSTRNFPNRLGKNTNVYLGSAELAAICSKLGRIPDARGVHGATWACSTRPATRSTST